MKILKQNIVENPVHDKIWNNCWDNDSVGDIYPEIYNNLSIIHHIRDLIPYDKDIGGVS